MPQAALAFVGASLGSEVIGGAIGAAIGGAIGGGIGAEAQGGDFWQGALSGGITSGLGASDFLGFGGDIRNALGGMGIGAAGQNALLGGLAGGIGSAAGGGNFLEGALTGAVAPALMSGAKQALGWGTQAHAPIVEASPSGAYPSAAGQGIGLRMDQTLSGRPAAVAAGKTATSPVASTPNFLEYITKPDNLLPMALGVGANLYMDQKNNALAEKMQQMADPYASTRNALISNPQTIFDDPMYKALAAQGDEALMRQAAAMGKVDSGELTNRLSANRMALADQFYQSRLANLGSPVSGANAYGNVRNQNYLYGAMATPFIYYGWETGKRKGAV